jgi:hypothetical protein
MVFEPRRFGLDVARTGRDCQRYSSLSGTGKAFTDMVKTGAAGGEMHNSLCRIGSSPAANLMQRLSERQPRPPPHLLACVWLPEEGMPKWPISPPISPSAPWSAGRWQP